MSVTILRPGQRLIVPGVEVMQTSASLTPPSANMMAWFRAHDTTTIFQDSAGTTPASANNDPIGKWNDKSGNTRHATQATSGKRPLLAAALINGRNAVKGDGTDDFLLTPSITHSITTGNFHVIAVVQRHAAGATSYQNVCSNANVDKFAFYVRSGSNKLSGYTTTDRVFDSALVVTTNYLLEFWRDSGTIKAAANATQEATTFVDAASIANGTLSLFASGSGGVQPASIYIAEFLFYNAFSAGQQTSLRSYLNSEYALY